MGKNKIRILDEHYGSYFRELRNNFWVKIPGIKLFDADPDPGDTGSGILDGKNSDPGFGINIRDPQRCWRLSYFN
jgi:hypothetical protein